MTFQYLFKLSIPLVIALNLKKRRRKQFNNFQWTYENKLCVFINKKKYNSDLMNKKFVRKNNVKGVKVLEGIFRKTLAYNNELMLCYFFLKKGAEIPIHFHKEYQIGYVIKGKLKFITEDKNFIVREGDSYFFDSKERHGALALKDSEVIDVFNPSREEYKTDA